jgi:hypothetical protein
MACLISVDGSSTCVISGAEWVAAHHRRVVAIDIVPSRSGAFVWYVVAQLDDATRLLERFGDLSVCRHFASGADVRRQGCVALEPFPNAAITDHTLTPRYKPDHMLYPSAIFLGRTHNTDLYVMSGQLGLVPMARIDAQSALYPLYPLTPEHVAQYRREGSPLAIAHDLAVAAGHIPEDCWLASASQARD